MRIRRFAALSRNAVKDLVQSVEAKVIFDQPF